MPYNPVYTERLIDYNLPALSAQHVVTVPAGFVWVIRNIEAWFTETGELYVANQGASQIYAVIRQAPAGGAVHLETRIAFKGGETIALSTGPSNVQGSITGYVFSTD